MVVHSVQNRAFCLVAVAAACLILDGCSSAKADQKAALEKQMPRVRLSSTEPLVLFAKEGARPGEVSVALLNQTRRSLRVLPNYFAVISDPSRRRLRVFDPSRDQAKIASTELPPESQATLSLAFRGAPALGGLRLVFNAEPEGWPPVFAEIEARHAPSANAEVVLP